MYKIFTLALAVSVVPLSQKNLMVNFSVNNIIEKPAYPFHFKNTISTNPFEPEKKPAEAWSQNWMATAQENIRKSEYNFKWEEKLKAYCTPNRKNNLRFFYDEKGFIVEPRTTKIRIGEYDPVKLHDEIKYKSIPNWKVKFNLDKRQLGKGFWQVTGNKAEYITNNITVQYINNDEGMRQNFIVHSPLFKDYEFKINISIKTKLKIFLKNNRLQFLHKKNTVLNYEDLKVWDANGKPLPANIKKIKGKKYAIEVNTAGATYPVTIDPISTTPSATLENNQASAGFGRSVASAGDVNGDGYSDVIIGSNNYDSGETDEGAAFIYHGSASGISTTPAATVQSDQALAHMGNCVSTAGDVNGDGYSDVIVAAYQYDDGQSDEGKVYIYHGSASGINTTPAATVESNRVNGFMGWSAASAGDINADGFSDIIVGVVGYTNPLTNQGAIFVYHGSAGGINTTIAATIEGNQSFARFGEAVACAGDVNGDGYSDVISGAATYTNGENNEGAFFVYHGSAVGINTTPAATVESNQASALLGYSASSAGDVNGDGYSDVIVGAAQYTNGQSLEGGAFIYHGSVAGINTTAAATVESNSATTFLGFSVACAGDLNGDGYSDVIAGGWAYSNGEANEGVAMVYQGSASGINITAIAILECNQATASMGHSVASAGDVNGDGYSDVIVGSPNFDNGQADEGAAFVYHGSAAGVSATPNSTPDDANQADALFGVSVASAGDVNADGFGDVIIGAYLYDDGANNSEGRAFVYHGSAAGLAASPNSTPDDADQGSAQFGWSVASAGDVNGDGYSDVIIGANAYNDGANTDEGRAFVYHGSASGIAASPNNTPDDADQIFAQLGISVASAGDVNGDGYSDVIIGAFAYTDAGNSAEGRAFVYHGSATGLAATFNSAPDDANQASALFGVCVASAGDVNGDGYSDVIIGAHLYDDAGNTDEGRAYVYHGSATGIAASPNNTPDDANQAGAQFGRGVGCAGDVNGDGFSDVIVGAYSYDDGANADEGRAFVYYGSATGLPATPNNTPDDADQLGAQMGFCVASAGDVNGDGYSDVIIGAHTYNDGVNTDEGRAFIYLGSSTGLSASPASTPDDANQASAEFGGNVACAGDINGDGYSDVIVGAVLYDDGANTNEGAAFVYHGNEFITNKRNNLRLYNTDLITPITTSNFIFSNFGAGLYARSFLGRSKGKLVWETRLNYNAYSGTPITNSTFFTSQQASYTDMGLTGIELKNIIQKIGGGLYTKLRARIKYDPVTAITGQVYSPWRNVSSIIDANNLGVLPIELISFNAAWMQKGKAARLDFITDKESGICCFDIEKSLDGFNFYSIGSLAAKNTSAIQSYSFIDNNATNKKQFYRLKIKGLAGQVEYSNIQQLSAGSGGQNIGATEILVFPNPTTDVLQLQLNRSFDKMNVQIINGAGQLVKRLVLTISNQTIPITIGIPVQNLAAGKYWLHLQSGGEKQVLQFVKQ